MKKIILINLFLIAYAIGYAQTLTVNTAAGNGEPGFSGDDDAAIAAQLYFPYGLGIDNSANLYIGEYYNYRVRKVSSSGLISTIAGTGNQGYSNDGSLATTADISLPSAVAVDAGGNVYFADYGNARIRKIATNGTVTTIAGTGTVGYSGDGGPATSANINTPSGLAIDAIGNIYFTDRSSNVIRKIDTSGVISTIAGTGASGFGGDLGTATSATLSMPHGIAIGPGNKIYFADMANNRIRMISNGTITTVAGDGTAAFGGDGGAATSAQINLPHGVAVDTTGNIYISDYGNNAIRKVNTLGSISTIAGASGKGYGGDDGPAEKSGVAGPVGIVCTPGGTVYFVDAINNRVRVIK